MTKPEKELKPAVEGSATEKPTWRTPKVTVLEVEKITLDGGGGASEGGATHS